MGGYHPIGVFGDFADNPTVNEKQQSGFPSAILGRHPICTDCGLRKPETLSRQESDNMKISTQDKVEGTAKNISGIIKVIAGKAVDSQRLQAEGKAEKTEGRIQKKIGEIERVLGS